MTVHDTFDHWRNFEEQAAADGPPGPARRAEILGRCRRCWGSVAGTKATDGKWTSITCALCTNSLHGKEADQEAQAMVLEMEKNLKPARVGHPPTYREGANFVLKIAPDMVRSSQKQVDGRHRAAKATKKSPGRLNRADVRPGEAGYLYLQARAITSGVETLAKDASLFDLLDLEVADTRITGIGSPDSGEFLQVHGRTPYRQPSDGELMAWAGRTMVAGMALAFACEVGMKAILLTRLDQSRKTHDLLDLYEDLPEDARERIEADARETRNVLERHRQAFHKWRYLQRSAGKEAFLALVNWERVSDLGKAARVVLDECLTTGLKGHVRVDSRFSVTEEVWSELVHLQVEGGEAEIPWGDVLASGRDDRS